MAGAEELVLTAADGARFLAHGARTSVPDAPGVVVMPDVRGLHPFYRELAERFAQAGVHAVAIDYFGRTAGTEPRDPVSFAFRPHVERTTPDGVAMDVGAAVAHLRSEAGGRAERVFTVGFCFGGRHSFNQAARNHGLAGVIGFYGWPAPSGPDDRSAPELLAPSYRCPVLGLFAGADPGIPPADVDRFRRALDAAGVGSTILIYEGAPHSFFDREADRFRAACEDAWRRILAFLRGEDPASLGPPPR